MSSLGNFSLTLHRLRLIGTAARNVSVNSKLTGSANRFEPLMSCHVMSCHVMPCHVMSCGVVSCHVMSCHVVYIRSSDFMSLLCYVKNGYNVRYRMRFNTAFPCSTHYLDMRVIDFLLLNSNCACTCLQGLNFRCGVLRRIVAWERLLQRERQRMLVIIELVT